MFKSTIESHACDQSAEYVACGQSLTAVSNGLVAKGTPPPALCQDADWQWTSAQQQRQQAGYRCTHENPLFCFTRTMKAFLLPLLLSTRTVLQ